MKREIKFRVWTGNEMEYNITTGKFGAFYVNPENGDGLNPKDTASLTTCTTKYPDDVPVMQLTGLKDKNGKEIYEGDILNPIMIGGSITKGIVLFQDAMFVVKQIGADGYIVPLYSQLNMALIIGNIYENPELLK